MNAYPSWSKNEDSRTHDIEVFNTDQDEKGISPVKISLICRYALVSQILK